MEFARLKVPHVGEFKCKDFNDLKKLVNDEDSSLRIKIEGIGKNE